MKNFIPQSVQNEIKEMKTQIEGPVQLPKLETVSEKKEKSGNYYVGLFFAIIVPSAFIIQYFFG